jgi:hypothetical protein
MHLTEKYPFLKEYLTHTRVQTMSLEDIVKLSARQDWKFTYMSSVVKI